MNRQDMVEAGAEAVRLMLRGPGEHYEAAIDEEDKRKWYRAYSRAVLDAVLPQITDASQMADVPPHSWVAVQVMGGVMVMEWDGSRLHGDIRIDKIPQLPERVIDRYGPLTVVARP